MIEALKNVYLLPTKLLKLRFRYRVGIGSVKVLVLLLELTRFDSQTITVFDLLDSVLLNIITPILIIQNSSVIWDSVSLIYPNKPNNKSDLLKIPFTDIQGLVNNESSRQFQTLYVNTRYEGRPLPIVTKIYGIDTTNIQGDIQDHLKIFNMAFQTRHELACTGIMYRNVMLSRDKRKSRKASLLTYTILK